LNQKETGKIQKVARRRRTRRHRRNRAVRLVLLLVFCVGLAIGFSSLALQYLSPSIFRSSNTGDPDRQAAEASRDLLLRVQQESLRQIEGRTVYPYSVVPGGVRDAQELKWVADHDPVVKAHYAGFDFDHAHVVRLAFERTAHVSYRIGNKVYWTRRRVKLKKGETLLTDGKITARTRCANRVEDVPQNAISAEEPAAARFDEPGPPAGTAVAGPPPPFESALMNRPGVPGLGPSPPLGTVEPFGNGTWIPIAPPPLPGVCGPGKPKPSPGALSVSLDEKKKKGGPCGGGGEVPEPGTWLLVASGLALLCWSTRHTFART
jgi:hypothetical protein